MRRRNPFDLGSRGSLGVSGILGGVNAGPTTSHLQLAIKERLAAKIAAAGLEEAVKVERKTAPAKPNSKGGSK